MNTDDNNNKKSKQSKLTDIFQRKNVSNYLPPTVETVGSNNKKGKPSAVRKTIKPKCSTLSSKQNSLHEKSVANQSKSIGPGTNSSHSSAGTNTSNDVVDEPTAENTRECVTNVPISVEKVADFTDESDEPAAAQIDSRGPGTNSSHSFERTTTSNVAVYQPVAKQIVSREPGTSVVNRVSTRRGKLRFHFFICTVSSGNFLNLNFSFYLYILKLHFIRSDEH